MGLVLSDPDKVAAAAPLTAAASLQNTTDATVSPVIIADISDPNLLQSVDIVFDDATTYRIFDGGGTDLTGPLAYTSGADINFNGWTLQISGVPATGDRFAIASTGGNSGDNTNALALTGLTSKGFFAGGQLSIGNLGANLLANVGSLTSRSSAELSVQSALRSQVELDLESVSGVNLEEEAVNMLRYQEAYLAASKIITVANELFQSLLNAIR